MKTETAITLILIVSAIITAIMVKAEMNTFTYMVAGVSSISATSFLPLVFGVVMSIVVATLKKNDKPEN